MAKTVKEQVEALLAAVPTDTLKRTENPLAGEWEGAGTTNTGQATSTGWTMTGEKVNAGAKRKAAGAFSGVGGIVAFEVGVLPAAGQSMEMQFGVTGEAQKAGLALIKTAAAACKAVIFGTASAELAGVGFEAGDLFALSWEPSGKLTVWRKHAGVVSEVLAKTGGAAPSSSIKPAIFYFPEGIAGTAGRIANFAVTLLESGPKTVSLTDSTTPTESLTKKATKGLSDSTTPTETLVKKVTKGLADSTTPTEAWALELIAPEPEPRPTVPAAAVLSEPVDDTLFVKLGTAEGRQNRWSGIEPVAAAIATGITFGNTAPGGHRSGGLTLLRDPRLSFSDLNFIDDIVIYGRVKPLGRNAFEGMNVQFPAQLGDSSSIGVTAVGNQELLTENEAWRALYVDLGFSNWQEARLARKKQLAESGIPQGKIALSTGEDGLAWTVPNQSLSPAEDTEAIYRAPAGCPVGAFGYKGTRVKNWASFEAPTMWASDTEAFSEGNANIGLTLDGLAHTWALTGIPGKAFKYLLLRAHVGGAAVIPEAGTLQTYSALATYGDTGVALREIPGQLPGVYGHDVLAHIVSTGAPDLNYTVGGDGSIVPNTSFVVPDFAPTEPGKPLDAVEKLNAYFLNNFGVWDDKEFFWKPWNPEDLNWQISIAGGAQWSPVGRQAQTLINGLVVSYTDAEGINRTAGPPGSGCDYESPLLVNPDPTNPYTRRGRRRWGTLSVGFPLAYPATAFQVGSIVLAEAMMPQRSGSLTIRPRGAGHIPSITHPTMGQLPVWALRAGDYATLMDWPVPEPLRVTQVDYNHDQKTLTAQLDSGAARLSAILERTGSRLAV